MCGRWPPSAVARRRLAPLRRDVNVEVAGGGTSWRRWVSASVPAAEPIPVAPWLATGRDVDSPSSTGRDVGGQVPAGWRTIRNAVHDSPRAVIATSAATSKPNWR